MDVRRRRALVQEVCAMSVIWQLVLAGYVISVFEAARWCVRDIRGFDDRLRRTLYGEDLPVAKVVRR